MVTSCLSLVGNVDLYGFNCQVVQNISVSCKLRLLVRKFPFPKLLSSTHYILQISHVSVSRMFPDNNCEKRVLDDNEMDLEVEVWSSFQGETEESPWWDFETIKTFDHKYFQYDPKWLLCKSWNQKHIEAGNYWVIPNVKYSEGRVDFSIIQANIRRYNVLRILQYHHEAFTITRH